MGALARALRADPGFELVGPVIAGRPDAELAFRRRRAAR
jgi:hypothetical protein